MRNALAFRGLRLRRLGAMLGGEDVPASPVTAILMGQSEIEYLFNIDGAYSLIADPVPGDGNLIVFRQAGTGVAPVRTVVNAASVAAGLVNPAMAALSALLAHARPGRVFVVGDGAVAGTARGELVDDTESARLWTDFTSVVDAIEGEFGSVGHLMECWYNADAAKIATFQNSFWPMYFGMTGAGAAFTLGTMQGDTQVDHCMWDGAAALDAKGRGLFARDETAWHILTPMPFHNAPVDPSPEMGSFSENNGRLSEPDRATMIALADNALAQSVSLQVGPSAHLCKFGGTSSEIHPDTGNPDGQVLLTWPFAVALLRASGMTIAEPEVVGIEGPTDGTYADLLVSLPNGGTLSTLRAFREAAAYAGDAPHQQAVTGIEATRAGTRHPIYRTSEVTYPASHRGTVVIHSAAETHGTYGRVGRVRITPSTPFDFGDTLSYLRGQGTAVLLEPRDIDLYPDFLMEHIPALYDDGATYPFEGLAVRPFQEDIAVPVPAPAFTARSADFDGASCYAATSGVSVLGGGQGLLSMWFRYDGASWPDTPARRLFQFRQSSTIVLEAVTVSSSRMQLRVNHASTGDAQTFYATPGGAAFVPGQWYHLMSAWNGTTWTIWINGQQVATAAMGAPDFSGANLTQAAIGAQTTASGFWSGDIGHLWLSVNQTLDLSVQANREKFALAGAPVNLGGNGEIPTGTAPQWYYDGDGAGWVNVGTAGNVALTGALTAGGTPGYTP